MNPEYQFVPPQSTTEPEPPPVVQPEPEPTPVAEPVLEPAAPEPEPQADMDSGEYQFVYGYPTTYPNLGLTFQPGDVHDWPDGPPTDGRWTPTTEKEQ